MGAKYFSKIDLKSGLPPGPNRIDRCMEYRLQVKGGSVLMVGHALWFDKFYNNFYEDDGGYPTTFHQSFFSGVSG
jgi:hypothetical protein